MSKPGVMIYHDFLLPLEMMTNEQAGELFKAILSYSANGEVPDFKNDNLPKIWQYVKAKVDEDNKRYEDIAEKRRAAANKRYENK